MNVHGLKPRHVTLSGIDKMVPGQMNGAVQRCAD